MTNPTRIYLIHRAAAILSVAEDREVPLSKMVSQELTQEYADLKLALTSIWSEVEPNRTLWNIHCFTHRLSPNHELSELL